MRNGNADKELRFFTKSFLAVFDDFPDDAIGPGGSRRFPARSDEEMTVCLAGSISAREPF